jgi:hypothetical protein
MKKLFALIILFHLCHDAVYAQFPGILWKKCFGGTADEQAYSMQPAYDSGYVMAGSTRSNDSNVTGNHGGLDCWIVKASDTGSILWQKSLGGSADEEANCIVATEDFGYIIAGYSRSNDGDVTGHHGTTTYADYWVVKLDAFGNIQWQKSYGGSGNDVAQSVFPTKDGGYVVAGYSNSTDGDVTGNHGGYDYWVVKLTYDGAMQWQRSYGGNNDDLAFGVQQTGDEGYILAGYTGSDTGDVSGNHGDIDCWLVRLTPSGNILWQKTYGGSSMDVALSVQITSDNGYIFGGNSYSSDGEVTGHHAGTTYEQDGWVVKTDDTGGIQWQRSLGGSSDDGVNSIIQVVGDNYLVAGTTMSSDGDVTGHIDSLDSWISLLSPTGSILSQKCMGGSGLDEAYAIFPTGDTGFIVMNSTTSNNDEVQGNHGGYDYWLVKLGLPSITTSQATIAQPGINVTPNPATNSFTVGGVNPASIRIYSVLGNIVAEAQDTNIISVSSLTPGEYIMVLLDDQGTMIYRNKVVKM